MSALRFCALAVCVLAFASVSDAEMMPWTGAGCPASPSSVPLFGNSSVKCTKADACQAAFCTCIGAAAPTNWTCGAYNSSAPNCTVASACTAQKIVCINAAADDVSAGCTALKDLKMSNLAVAGGKLYNASAGYLACKYEVCKSINMTAGNCSLDYTVLCASPVKFIGTLLLKGNWAPFLNDPVKKAKLQAALEKDLTKVLGFVVKIIRMFLRTNKRRQSEGTLAIEFEASGVSANNEALKSALGALKDTSFLTETLKEYVAENGADATIGFVGIAAGSSSSAVFSGLSGSDSVTTATTSTTTGTTTTSTTGSISGSSGAATQSLLAAVVVAIVGAMLF